MGHAGHLGSLQVLGTLHPMAGGLICVVVPNRNNAAPRPLGEIV